MSSTDIADLRAPQKKYSHFGGNYVLLRPSSRVRRIPVRFRDIAEETALDENLGSHEIDYASNEGDTSLLPEDDRSEQTETTEEAIILPNLPCTFYQRKRAVENQGEPPVDPTVPEHEAVEVDPTAPVWVQKLNLPGITFDATFEKYRCACKKSTVFLDEYQRKLWKYSQAST